MTNSSTFIHESVFPCTPEELHNWHNRAGALQRLLPPWDRTVLLNHKGGIAPGATAALKIKVGPLPISWNARHVLNEPGVMFQDIQETGPFKKWVHTHTFKAVENGCRLEDKIEYQLPLHSLIPPMAHKQVEKMLEQMFTYRHTTLLHDIKLHHKHSQTSLNILITGASGVLGSNLKPLLTTGGHKVWSLVRRTPDPDKNEVFWNPEQGIIDTDALPLLDGVIHLAGDNIGKGRWSDQKKKVVIDSRVQGTELIAKTIATLPQKPKVFLSASAVGFYGDCQDCCMNEEDKSGLDFISDVCSLWERSAIAAQQAGIRTVFMRIGVVLTPKGGALKQLLTTAPVGFAKSFGSGKQFISWISIDDMTAAILHTLTEESLSGPVNIAAPTPVSNSILLQTMAKVMKRPLFPSIPESVLKTIFGQMATEVLLSGCRVSTDKLQCSGFSFRHPTLEQALRSLLGRESQNPAL